MNISMRMLLLLMMAFGEARVSDGASPMRLPNPEMSDSNAVPLYLIEFASHLGIEIPSSCSRTEVRNYIQAEARRIGGIEITNRARQAQDAWAGGNYFVLKQMENTLLISRRFVLSDQVRFVDLFVKVEASGDYYIVFGEAVQSGGL
jgi:hypothetical protein